MAVHYDSKKGRSLDNIIAKLSKERSFQRTNRILLVSETNNACVALSSDDDSDEKRAPDLHQCGNSCYQDYETSSWTAEDEARSGPRIEAICDSPREHENRQFSPTFEKRKHERKGPVRKLDRDGSPELEDGRAALDKKQTQCESSELDVQDFQSRGPDVSFRPHSADEVASITARHVSEGAVAANPKPPPYNSTSSVWEGSEVRRRSSDILMPPQRPEDTSSRGEKRITDGSIPYPPHVYNGIPGMRQGSHPFFNGAFQSQVSQPQSLGYRPVPNAQYQDNLRSSYFSRGLGYPPVSQTLNENWQPVSVMGQQRFPSTSIADQFPVGERRGPDHTTSSESRRRSTSASSTRQFTPLSINNDAPLTSPPSKPPELVKVADVLQEKPTNPETLQSPVDNEELLSNEGDMSRDSETPSVSLTMLDERYVRSVSPVRSSSPVDIQPRTSSAPATISLSKISVPSSNASKRSLSTNEDMLDKSPTMQAFQGDDDYTNRPNPDRVFAVTSPNSDPSWRHSKQAYRCPLCAKVFPFKSKLQRHVLVHTGIKPYKCHVCGRGFTQQIDLQRHLTRHTGEKPFKCHLCKAQFIRADNLRKHAKDTHYVSIEEPTRKRRRKTAGSDTVLPPLEVAIAMAISETEKNGGRVLGRKTAKFGRGGSRPPSYTNTQTSPYNATMARPNGIIAGNRGSRNGPLFPQDMPPMPPNGHPVGMMFNRSPGFGASNAFWRDGRTVLSSPGRHPQGPMFEETGAHISRVEADYRAHRGPHPMKFDNTPMLGRSNDFKREHCEQDIIDSRAGIRQNDGSEPPSMLSVHDIRRGQASMLRGDEDQRDNAIVQSKLMDR